MESVDFWEKARTNLNNPKLTWIEKSKTFKDIQAEITFEDETHISFITDSAELISKHFYNLRSAFVKNVINFIIELGKKAKEKNIKLYTFSNSILKSEEIK